MTNLPDFLSKFLALVYGMRFVFSHNWFLQQQEGNTTNNGLRLQWDCKQSCKFFLCSPSYLQLFPYHRSQFVVFHKVVAFEVEQV